MVERGCWAYRSVALQLLRCRYLRWKEATSTHTRGRLVRGQPPEPSGSTVWLQGRARQPLLQGLLPGKISGVVRPKSIEAEEKLWFLRSGEGAQRRFLQAVHRGARMHPVP